MIMTGDQHLNKFNLLTLSDVFIFIYTFYIFVVSSTLFHICGVPAVHHSSGVIHYFQIFHSFTCNI